MKGNDKVRPGIEASLPMELGRYNSCAPYTEYEVVLKP